MTFRAASGPALVLTSGSVTAFWGHPIHLEVPLESGPFRLHFFFTGDPAVEGVGVHTAEIEGGLAFQLVNFDDDQGRGSARPVLLGEVGDHLVFLHFRVFRFGRTEDRTLHYTVYQCHKKDVDWEPVEG